MTPLSNTIFTIGLFLALVALWQWSKRRRRVSRMVSRAVRSLNQDDAA